jgi:hypothetical protein
MSFLLRNTFTGVITSTDLFGEDLDLFLREYPELVRVGIATTENSNYYVLLNSNKDEFTYPSIGTSFVFNPFSNVLGIGTITISPSNLSGISSIKINSLNLSGSFYDSTNNSGFFGQILSSTGSSTQWINSSSANVGSASSIGITLDSENVTKYITFVNTTSGNNYVRVDGDLSYNPSTNILTANRLTLNGAGSPTSAQLNFNGTTNNWINFSTTGVAAPTFTTRSVGTKIVLYEQVGASSADYGFGIENNTLWSSVPSTSSQFKWYGGTTLAATLTGSGNFSAGTITATTFNGSGSSLTGIVTSLTAGPGISLNPSTGNVTITATGGGGGSSQFVTTAAGIHTLSNVGIGTTNPTSALTVSGVVSATSFYGALNAGQLTGPLPAIDGSALLNVTAVETGVAIRDDNSIIGSASTINFGTGLDVTFSSGIATVVASGGNSSQWVTTAAGIHTLSNVGIGTTNPTSALTVSGNGSFTGVVTATSFVGSVTGTATTATGLSGNPSISVTNVNASGIVTASSFVGSGVNLTGIIPTNIVNGNSNITVNSNNTITTTVNSTIINTVSSNGIEMSSGKRFDLSSFTEKVNTLGSAGSPISGSNNLDIGIYSTFIAYVGTNSVTFNLANVTNGKLVSWTIILIYTNSGSRIVNFSFGTLRYPGGASSVTLSDTAVHDVLSFFTADGASNTYASVIGLGFAT